MAACMQHATHTTPSTDKKSCSGRCSIKVLRRKRRGFFLFPLFLKKLCLKNEAYFLGWADISAHSWKAVKNYLRTTDNSSMLVQRLKQKNEHVQKAFWSPPEISLKTMTQTDSEDLVWERRVTLLRRWQIRLSLATIKCMALDLASYRLDHPTLREGYYMQ